MIDPKSAKKQSIRALNHSSSPSSPRSLLEDLLFQQSLSSSVATTASRTFRRQDIEKFLSSNRLKCMIRGMNNPQATDDSIKTILRGKTPKCLSLTCSSPTETLKNAVVRFHKPDILNYSLIKFDSFTSLPMLEEKD